MANELTVSFTFDWINGNRRLNRSNTTQVTVAGTDWDSGVQNIGTTEETLSLKAEIGTPGFVYFWNQDDTNYIEIGPATGVYFVKLAAGQWCVLPLTVAASSIYCKANTAACDLEFGVLEI